MELFVEMLMFGWSWSWCLVETLMMKFDQDLCLNLWYELNPRVRCAFGNVWKFMPHCWKSYTLLVCNPDSRVTFQHARAKQEARSYRGITLPRGLCGSQRGAARIWTPPPRGRNTGTTNTRFWDNSGNSGAMAMWCKDMCLIDKRQWELLEGYTKERHLLGGWSSREGLECCLRRCPARVIPAAGGWGISNLIW